MNDTATSVGKLAAPRLSASLWLALNLIPLGLALFYRLAYPTLVAALGLPPQYVSILSWASILVLELGFMLYLGRRLTGRLTLKGIVVYREALPWWQYIAFVVLFLVWAFGVMALLAPVSTYLRETVFVWAPAGASPVNPDLYSQAGLYVTVLLIMILNPLAGGVEEFYFRGYLMPRMSQLRWWAPAVSVVLWAISHVSQLWDVPGFLLMFLPMAYFTQWKRNVYLIAIVHALGNLVAVSMAAVQVTGGGG